MGAFCCHGHQSSNLPQNSMQPSPTPSDAIHKIWSRLANWTQRYSSSTKWVVWSGPKNSFELLCLSWIPATLMMIRSKVNELAWRQHFPIISLWDCFLDAQGQLTPSVVRPGWKSNSSEISCMSSLPANKKDRIKNNREKVETSFSPL